MNKAIVAGVAGFLLANTALAVPLTNPAQLDAGSTHITFDELADGTTVNNQYAALGVTISGTTLNNGSGGSTPVIARPWDPIYIGNQLNGWNGSVIFDFSGGVTQFGIELIDSLPSYISVYDAANNLIETVVTTISGNGFVGVDTGVTLIKKAIVSGEFYALDDLRFNHAASSVPEGGSTAIVFGLGLAGLAMARQKSVKA